MEKYLEEDSAILKYLVEDYFLTTATKEHELSLELFITPSCDQKCEYCYLQKNKELLYPSEIINYDNILKNFKILFQYLKEKQFFVKKIDLFSGEIWANFGLTFLQALLEEYQVYHYSDTIVIPSNMNFIHNEEATNKIQEIIDAFTVINVRLIFSASIDGKILDDKYRPYNNENLSHTDEFYHKVFTFCKKNGYAFHPMVYADNCKDWIENYKWFLSQFDKYGFQKGRLMTLAVRNDNWTDENLKDYIKFLDYLIDFRLNEIYKGDKTAFALEVFKEADLFKNFYLNTTLGLRDRLISCNLQNSLYVRLGDLAIVPCHRTSYDSLIYGKFLVENDKIIGFEGKNVALANFLMTTNPATCFPKCSACPYSLLCEKGCLGAQLEENNDLFVVCDSVCEMHKTKIKHLILTYEKMGLFELIKDDLKVQRTLQIIKELRKKENF